MPTLWVSEALSGFFSIPKFEDFFFSWNMDFRGFKGDLLYNIEIKNEH